MNNPYNWNNMNNINLWFCNPESWFNVPNLTHDVWSTLTIWLKEQQIRDAFIEEALLEWKLTK